MVEYQPWHLCVPQLTPLRADVFRYKRQWWCSTQVYDGLSSAWGEDGDEQSGGFLLCINPHNRERRRAGYEKLVGGSLCSPLPEFLERYLNGIALPPLPADCRRTIDNRKSSNICVWGYEPTPTCYGRWEVVAAALV